MSWIERVRRNIFPVSQENKVLTKALNEWVYYGEMFDLENIDESCELCDHPNIRYQFVIVNILNGNILLIGSECINRFNIGVIDKKGKILNSNEARRKVSQDKYKLIANAKTKSVINSLIMLSKQDQDFGEEKLKSFIGYFKERKAFTPEQLAIIIWRLEKCKIQYNISHFKLIIRRNREKEQLLGMEDWKIKKIWPCLSSSQKKFYEEKAEFYRRLIANKKQSNKYKFFD